MICKLKSVEKLIFDFYLGGDEIIFNMLTILTKLNSKNYRHREVKTAVIWRCLISSSGSPSDSRPPTPDPRPPTLDSRPLTPDPRLLALDSTPLTPGPRLHALNSRPLPSTPGPRLPALDSRPSTPSPRLPALDSRPLTPGPRLPALDSQPLTSSPQLPNSDPPSEFEFKYFWGKNCDLKYSTFR
jgi:hypothetical protein